MPDDYILNINGLTKNFGNIRALNNLSLKIPKETTFGLIGPNGAGKTTLIRILTCIYEPEGGTAFVSGYDIKKNKNKIKRICGLLPQNPGIYNKLTAKEYLEFVGELYNLSKNVISLRIDKFLKMFNLKERKNDLLEGFSRGMQQKIAFSAALIHDPQILFLDEPTSNLDPASTRTVKDFINMLSEKTNKTLFISTNSLNDAEELCDIIGIINKGIIQVIGTPEDIINNASAKNLEEVYLNIVGKPQPIDVIEWKSIIN